MNSPIGRARLQMVEEGVEPQSLLSRWGYEQTRMFHRVFERRRVKRLEFAQYLTNMVYSMAGVPDEVTPGKRFDALDEPYQRLVETVTGDRYTVERQRQKALEQYREAKKNKERMEMLDKIGSGDFDIGAWMRGEI